MHQPRKRLPSENTDRVKETTSIDSGHVAGIVPVPSFSTMSERMSSTAGDK